MIRNRRIAILRVVAIRRLKPRPRVLHVRMQRTLLVQLVVDAIEEVLLVALGVIHRELRCIEKPPRLQPIRRDEVAPVLAAIRHIEGKIARAEAAIAERYASGRRGNALARARRRLDHQARLVAILRRWCAIDNLQRLHCRRRHLVRKHLALLVRNRLAIDAERVLRMIAQSVHQAVRVRRNARRGKRHNRTQLRRRALQRQVVDHGAIDIRMRRRVVVHQISRSRHRHRLVRRRNLQHGRQRHRNRRAHPQVFAERLEPRLRHRHVIRIEREVGEMKLAIRIRCNGLRESTDRIGDHHLRSGNHRTGRIGHRSTHTARATLAEANPGIRHDHEAEHQPSKSQKK